MSWRTGILISIVLTFPWAPIIVEPAALLVASATTDDRADHLPRLAASPTGVWIAVWQSQTPTGDGLGTDHDILFTRSTDGGATFGPATALDAGAATDSMHDVAPVVATDGVGHWIAAWTDSDTIRLSRSSDDGASWSSPLDLAPDGADSGLALSFDPVSAVIAYRLTGAAGSDHDIVSVRSTDKGASWEAEKFINTGAGSDSGTDGLPDLASNGAGGLVAVWASSDDLGGAIGTDYDVLFAQSVDGGATWTPPSPLHASAFTDDGDDLHPSVASDEAGGFLSVWSSSFGRPGYDVVGVFSADDGSSWSLPFDVGSTGDDVADLLPEVTSDRSGNWITAFSAERYDPTFERDLWMVRSTSDGAVWSTPEALAHGASPSENHNPSLATDGLGRWRAVFSSSGDPDGTLGSDLDIVIAKVRPAISPGTDEDLILLTGSEGSPNLVERVTGLDAFDSVSLRLQSPRGTYVGEPFLLVAEVFATGSLPVSPFPGIAVSGRADATVVVYGASADDSSGSRPLLPAGGLDLSFAYPPALVGSGLSVMIQGFVQAPAPVVNGLFASTDGHELTDGP